MKHIILPLALLAALTMAPTADGQTCGGTVMFEVHAPGRPNYLYGPGRDVAIDATVLTLSERGARGGATPARLPVDSVLSEAARGGGRFALAERFTLPIRPATRFYLQAPLTFRWGCDTYAARFVFTRDGETMTLDLYGGPRHAPLRLAGPIAFRPGHFAVDLASAPYLQFEPVSPAPAVAP